MKRAPAWIVIALLLLVFPVRSGQRVQGRRSGRRAGGGQGVNEAKKEGSERGGGLPGARAVWFAKRPRFYSQQHQTSTELGAGGSQAAPKFRAPRVVRNLQGFPVDLLSAGRKRRPLRDSPRDPLSAQLLRLEQPFVDNSCAVDAQGIDTFFSVCLRVFGFC